MNAELQIKNCVDIEGDFNHQHIMAEGATGLLFEATINGKGSINNLVLNSSAYAIQSSLREMNKEFEALLNLVVDVESKADKQIEEMRIVEADRQIDIMEIFYEFGDECPQLKNDAIDAVRGGTTSAQFKEHSLKIKGMKNKAND